MQEVEIIIFDRVKLDITSVKIVKNENLSIYIMYIRCYDIILGINL